MWDMCKFIFIQWAVTRIYCLLSLKKLFLMIWRPEMTLSVASYVRKKIIYFEKNVKLTKNKTFNNSFFKTIFLYFHSLSIFLKLLDFNKSWLIFSGEIFFRTLLFPILKKKSKIFKYIIVFFEKDFSLKNSFNDFSH